MYKEPVSLYSVSDWSRWYDALEQEAVKYGVWKYVKECRGDPSKWETLTRPEVPILPECLQHVPSCAEDGDEAMDAYQRAFHYFNEVTLPMHQLELKRYDAEWEGLQRVEEFFDRTVSKWDFGEVFTCSGSLRERVTNLRRVLQPSMLNQIIGAYNQLHEHLHALPDDDDPDWFVDWSRNLRERLLRCEELHVGLTDNDVRAISDNALEKLFPNHVLATFSRKFDADVVKRKRALVEQREVEVKAWAWAQSNAGAYPWLEAETEDEAKTEAEAETGVETGDEAEDETEAETVAEKEIDAKPQ